MLWLIGFIISLLMGIFSYQKKTLSKSGVIGAIMVGTLILGGMGWFGFLVLAYFFVTSSFGSKWLNRNQAKDQIVVKGDQRDIIQVLANGGVGACCALLFWMTSQPIWIVMFVSSLAAATSDTWASEFGKRSKSWPRDALTWRRMEPGTSGAISLMGLSMSILGAISTVLVSIPLLTQNGLYEPLGFLILMLSIAGWLGNWIDTWIGALWQVRYQCQVCERHTEQTEHCQLPTKHFRGLKWLDNDAVNFVCTGSATLIAAIGYVILVR